MRPYVDLSRTMRDFIPFSIALDQKGGLPKWSATPTFPRITQAKLLIH